LQEGHATTDVACHVERQVYSGSVNAVEQIGGRDSEERYFRVEPAA
jgi:hypothetical protein